MSATASGWFSQTGLCAPRSSSRRLRKMRESINSSGVDVRMHEEPLPSYAASTRPTK